ncbi:MAG: MoaD/ThiS family protein [Cyanobacteriota bacterium]|nr:MoaD/ThiS family protein [Cyanobacteriota bacterium]
MSMHATTSTPDSAPACAPSGTLRVLLFAALREAAGWGERSWPLQPHDTPRRLFAELGLPGSLEQVRVAINQQFADPDTPLQAGDELAFLPPISGG